MLRNEAAKWLRQTAKDHPAARLLVSAEPSRSVFHCQQAAEKACKALLVFHQVAFRKTHDLTDPGSQCAAAEPGLEPILHKVAELTGCASAFRYPDAPYEPDAAEAEEALKIAAEFCDAVRLRIGIPPEF